MAGKGEGWEHPVAFHFGVQVGGHTLSFQEVSGISVEMQTGTVAEGGENRLVHELPTHLKGGKVDLKRAVARSDDPIVAWCREILDSDHSQPLKPKMVMVYLLDRDSKPLRGWSLLRAYPVKWSVDRFFSNKNELAIESITLCCAGIVRLQEP